MRAATVSLSKIIFSCGFGSHTGGAQNRDTMGRCRVANGVLEAACIFVDDVNQNRDGLSSLMYKPTLGGVSSSVDYMYCVLCVCVKKCPRYRSTTALMYMYVIRIRTLRCSDVRLMQCVHSLAITLLTCKIRSTL